MTIDNIALWHKRARPEPTEKDFNVQLGCHIEEFTEMLDAIGIDYNTQKLAEMYEYLDELADGLKKGYINTFYMDKPALLDALAYQIVTAVGVGVCAKMNMAKAVEEVNQSNWSKFNYKGFPEYDKYGKVKKGENYKPPQLEGMYE